MLENSRSLIFRIAKNTSLLDAKDPSFQMLAYVTHSNSRVSYYIQKCFIKNQIKSFVAEFEGSGFPNVGLYNKFEFIFFALHIIGI